MDTNVANVFAMMANDEFVTEDDQSMLEAWETASMASFDRDPLPTRVDQQFETTNMATEDTISQAMNEAIWYHASNAPDMEVEEPQEPNPWNKYWSTFGKPFSKTPWRRSAATETGTNAATSSSDPSTAIGTTSASASHDPDATLPTSAANASNASSTPDTTMPTTAATDAATAPATVNASSACGATPKAGKAKAKTKQATAPKAKATAQFASGWRAKMIWLVAKYQLGDWQAIDQMMQHMEPELPGGTSGPQSWKFKAQIWFGYYNSQRWSQCEQLHEWQFGCKPFLVTTC